MTNPTTPSSPAQTGARASTGTKITATPGFKFILLGFISLLLLLPTLLVWGVVEERAQRATDVAAEISLGWGGRQLINGPYLVIPYSVSVTRNNKTEQETRFATFSAEDAAFLATFDVEERRKSIYSTPLYQSKLSIKGTFAAVSLDAITARDGKPDLNNAFIAMGIADTSGFRSDVDLKIGAGQTRALAVAPGLRGMAAPGWRATRTARPVRSRGRRTASGGIHALVNESEARNGFTFDMQFVLNGSRTVAFVPAAKNTQLSTTSNWPHPGFDGRFLPIQRSITDTGFEAAWSIPNLARGIDLQTLGTGLPNPSSIIQINFVEPLKFYQIISRTLKYAIAFFALIFLAVFIMELSGTHKLHWIQYILVGLAMVVFYILLLALAEHIGFDLAYGLAATATALLIALYVGRTLSAKRSGIIMGVVIGLSYAIIYLVMKEQEYALLAGALIAFVAIATTMYATRDTDWSGTGSRNESGTGSGTAVKAQAGRGDDNDGNTAGRPF